MGERIQSNLEVSPRLKELLEQAKLHKMTGEETWEQRISWAYGQLAIGNEKITRDEVRAVAEKLYGRKGS